jgi:chaperone modulatory protein CbpM
MTKKTLMIVSVEEPILSLEELCASFNVSEDFIRDLVDFGIIEIQPSIKNIQFTAEDLTRIRKALRLHHDLEINLQGVAVVLELMEELDQLRAELEIFNKKL